MTDLTDKLADALEAICKNYDCDTSEGSKHFPERCRCCIAESALLAYRAQRDRESGGWISVEDRKPKDGEMVLVHFTEKRLERPVQEGVYYGGRIDEWRPRGTNSSFPASHWQPLPKPPLAKGEA